MRKPAKSYSDEFKRDALLLLAKSDKSQTEIEKDLGLSHDLLRKWRLQGFYNRKLILNSILYPRSAILKRVE
jgi:transposase-like protein